ncbi:LysE family translocator [Streptomyces sp. NPDC091272]|uniref:LysE family translocator n=1 Tax=Streptomyces sp. NPDC091272 TaxID=3365981 RepID=UPI003822DAAC
MVTDLSWGTFLPSALLLAATPGANQLLTLRNGLRHGLRSSVGASLGRFTAFALMVLAVAAGLGAALSSSDLVFNVVKWCGVAYLAWLGAHTVFTAWRSSPPGPGAPRAPGHGASEETGQGQPAPQSSPWRLARQEFLVAASNPKALILFAVFLPQFLPRGAESIALPLVALGAAYIAVEFCCACGYAAVGAWLKRTGRGTGQPRRVLDVLTGLAMFGLALWLATESR